MENEKLNNNIEKQNDNKQSNIVKQKNKKIYYMLSGGTVLCVLLCFFMGCFGSTNEIINHNKLPQPIQQIKSYDRLTERWNKAVNILDLPNKYRIKNREDIKDIAKLFNNLINNSNRYETFIKENECVLKYSKSNIYLPSKEYAKFLKKNQPRYKINFNENTSEKEIIEELKKITNTKYIGIEMVKKIVFLSDFSYYFKKNRKKFIENGFSKHITNFKLYEEAVSKCK